MSAPLSSLPLHVAALLLCATIAVLAGLARLLFARWRHTAMARGARLIQITPPLRDTIRTTARDTAQVENAISFWTRMLGQLRPAWKRALFGQPHFAWEYRFDQDGTHVAIWVPGRTPLGLVERALAAAWPGARLDTQPIATRRPSRPARTQWMRRGGILRLARPDTLPLRFTFDTDPLRALVHAGEHLPVGVRIRIQILARPTPRTAASRSLHRSWRSASERRAGRRQGVDELEPLVLQGLFGPEPFAWKAPELDTLAHHAGRLANISQARAIATKHQQPAYLALLRYTVDANIPAMQNDAPDIDRLIRQRVRKILRARAGEIAGAFAIYTGHNHFRRHRTIWPRTATATRLRWLPAGRADRLSVSELAALAHVPAPIGSSALVPPSAILNASSNANVKPIGHTNGPGHPRTVAISVRDARQHLHVLGATGSGKSSLITHLALADADAGRGMVVIDPKGDLVTDIFDRLPDHARDKLVLIDSRTDPNITATEHGPAYVERLPCINPLDTATGLDRRVDDLVGIVARLWSDSWGPRSEDILRSCLLTLARVAHDDPGRTRPAVPSLMDVSRLLTEPAYRQRVTGHVHDPVLAGFWHWYDAQTEAARAHAIAPLANKLRALMLRPFVRHLLAAGRATVDFGQILDGGILLVRVARDRLGEQTAALIGAITLSQLWHATTARAATPESERRDAALYLDEAHLFLHLPYRLEDLLAEARGYRLSITLAHQYLRQLPPHLTNGVDTNARNKIFFTIGPDDATHLASHTGPRFTADDLTRLGPYQAAARLVVDNTTQPAFTLTTNPLPSPDPNRRPAAKSATSPLVEPAPGGCRHEQTTPADPPRVDPRRAGRAVRAPSSPEDQ